MAELFLTKTGSIGSVPGLDRTARDYMPRRPSGGVLRRRSSSSAPSATNTRAGPTCTLRRFLGWAEKHGRGELVEVTPADVGRYYNNLKVSIGASRPASSIFQLRHFFDGLVTRHVIVLNPCPLPAWRALFRDGRQPPKLPSIMARKLRASIKVFRKKVRLDGKTEDKPLVVGLRDRGLLAILIYTVSRAGAVAKLARRLLPCRRSMDAALRRKRRARNPGSSRFRENDL
jgi:site-specific recombinase XerD